MPPYPAAAPTSCGSGPGDHSTAKRALALTVPDIHGYGSSGGRQMPRTKNFEVDVALDKAMRRFWQYGYHPTSIQILVQCMGIQRGSLYDTFDSKRALFIRALHFYIDLHRRSVREILHQSPSPPAAITKMFEEASDNYGCFALNTAIELAAHDNEIAQIVSDLRREIEHTFRTLIERGQRCGAIAAGVDPVHTARALLGMYIGQRVLVRSGAALGPILRTATWLVQSLLPAPQSLPFPKVKLCPERSPLQ